MGERRTIRLPDDGRVMLNTDSALDIAYTQNKRLLTLRRGELLVETHADPRAFFVATRHGRIRALGTRFSKNLEAHTYVMAIYDRVEIIRGATGLISGTGSPSAAIKLGSWDRYRIDGDLSTPLNADGSVRARVVAAHEDQRSFVERHKQKKDVLYAIVEADLTPSTVVSAGTHYQKEKLKSAGREFPIFYSDGSPTHFPRSMNGTAAWSTYDPEPSLLFATLKHYFDNDWIARLALSRSSNRYDALQGFAGKGYADRVSGGGLKLWLANWHSKPQQTSLDAYVSGPFEAFGGEHELALGVSTSELETHGPIYPEQPLPAAAERQKL